MSNKNLSQLPTNATPQETDWLLGASGVSPAVFQKIPVGAIQPEVPSKTSELQNDSNFVSIDLSGIQHGQSIIWDSSLQKFVFFCLALTAVEFSYF